MRDIGELQAAGAFGTSHSQVSSAGALGGSNGAGGLGKIGGDIGSSIPGNSQGIQVLGVGPGIDGEVFAAMNAGGGALGGDVMAAAEGVVAHQAGGNLDGLSDVSALSKAGQKGWAPSLQGPTVGQAGVFGNKGAEQ